MSCPPWSALVARRDRAGEDPAGWPEGLAHLDACPACREEALRADPTLLFRRLPRAEPGAAEIDQIRQGVAALRQASRLGVAREVPAQEEGEGRRWWRQGVAAAALAGLAVLTAPAPGPTGAGSRAGLPLEPARGAASRVELAGSAIPLIEDLDLPDPRVYQIAEDGVQVVMVFDASLELDP